METLFGVATLACLVDFLFFFFEERDFNLREDGMNSQNINPSLASSNPTSVNAPTKWEGSGPSYAAAGSTRFQDKAVGLST